VKLDGGHVTELINGSLVPVGVAVVVQTVADLRLSPYSVETQELTVATFGDRWIADSDRDADGVSTGLAPLRIFLVLKAVAIVVQAVACLVFSADPVATDQHAIDAVPNGLFTFAGGVCAAHVEQRVVLVFHSVAVVVQTVALLLLGPDPVETDQPTVTAFRNRRFADTNGNAHRVAAELSPAGISFVLVAVAIVVQAIALFWLGPDFVLADQLPVHTFPDGLFALARDVRAGLTPFRISFIPVAVAIVIDVVAPLFGTGVDRGKEVIAIPYGFRRMLAAWVVVTVDVKGFVNQLITVIIQAIAAFWSTWVNLADGVVAVESGGHAISIAVSSPGHALPVLTDLIVVLTGHAMAGIGWHTASQVAGFIDGTFHANAKRRRRHAGALETNLLVRATCGAGVGGPIVRTAISGVRNGPTPVTFPVWSGTRRAVCHQDNQCQR
jgi:hypothetical protein